VPGEISGGRYAPLDLLGAGGMAEVFLARDRILGRDLALKVLRGTTPKTRTSSRASRGKP
jgi:serine/threonine-protein kinase